MIVNSCGVVLSRRNVGEYDRFVVVFTESYGKLTARFGGVNRSAGKLKAVSEPFVWAEHRLYMSPRSPVVRVVGGRHLATFPSVREDLSRTLQALNCCEMLASLAPERQPSPEKYRLICEALSALESTPSPWVETAFALRLLELAGYGLAELPVPAGERETWAALHELGLQRLGELPYSRHGERLRELALDHVEAHAERRLKSRRVCAEMLSNLQPVSAPA